MGILGNQVRVVDTTIPVIARVIPSLCGLPNADKPDAMKGSGGGGLVFGGWAVKHGSLTSINKALSEDQKRPQGYISAQVTIQGRPVRRPVYVLNQHCERVYITHSDLFGRYQAVGLDQTQRYIVLALDKPDREYNAAISDYVQPE